LLSVLVQIANETGLQGEKTVQITGLMPFMRSTVRHASDGRERGKLCGGPNRKLTATPRNIEEDCILKMRTSWAHKMEGTAVGSLYNRHPWRDSPQSFARGGTERTAMKILVSFWEAMGSSGYFQLCIDSEGDYFELKRVKF
jgi:hypothetical protein